MNPFVQSGGGGGGSSPVAAITSGSISGADITVGSGKTLDVSAGTVTLADDQISGSKINGYMGKNAIINGNFDIWQRGTSFAVAAQGTYTTDRFVYSKNAGLTAVHTASQDTDVPTILQSGLKSNYSLKLDCTTSQANLVTNDNCAILHAVEGYNFSVFAGKIATLSFWVKATKTGIYCVSLRGSTSIKSYIVEYTVNTANTWEKKSITLTFSEVDSGWNYTNGSGISLAFVIACGPTYTIATTGSWVSGNYLATSNQVNACDSTDNNFWLSQVQLELGPVATDFEYRPYGLELMLCQRYYQRTASLSGATQGGSLCFIASSSNEAFGGIKFQIPMRATPTSILYNNAGTPGLHVPGVGDTITGVTIYANYQGVFYIAKTSGWTSGLIMVCNYECSAEL